MKTYYFHILLKLGILSLLLLEVVYHHPLHAQVNWDNPSFILTTDEGLPDNYIKSIAEDSYGFFWIGSNNGLSRYDGTRVEVIKKEGLPQAYYSKLLVDKKRDIIWLGSYLGLYNMDLKSQKVEQFTVTGIKKEFEHYVNALHLDRNDRLWVGSRKGFYHVDLESRELSYHLILEDSTDSRFGMYNNIHHILQDPDRDHILWIGAVGGFFKYDINKGKAELIKPQLEKLKSSKIIGYLYQDTSSHYIYASIRPGTSTPSPYQYLKFDPRQEKFVKGISIFDTWRSYKIFPHSQNRLCFSSNEGIAVYNTIEDKIEEVRKMDPSSGKSFRIEFMDSSERIWASNANGLAVYDPIQNQCLSAYYESNLPKAYHVITEIYVEPSGRKVYLAVFGGDGLYEYDLRKKSWEIYPAAGRDGQIFDATGVLTDKKGRVIVIANSNTYFLDRSAGLLKPMKLPFSLEEAGRGLKFIRDRKENALWLLYRRGLYYLNLDDNSYKSWPDFPEFCPESHTAAAMFQDKKGRIWFSGICDGFLVFDPKTEEVKNQMDFPILIQDFSNAEIGDIAELGDTVYVLSELLKLAKIPVEDLSAEHSRLLNLKDHIPSEKYPNLEGMSELGFAAATTSSFDQKGNYFILTTFGLLKYNPKDHSTEIYNEGEGFVFKDRELKVHVAEKLTSMPNGQMVYGSRKGIHFFDPLNLSKDERMPIPYIRNIDINDEAIESDSAFYFKKSHYLEAGEYYLSFDFSAIDQTSSNKRKYKHKLEGVDQEWRTLRDRNSISYPNLKGGDYTFKLMVSNKDGIWNPQVATASIKIDKFWYDTYFARAFGITFLICLAILWYHYRVKRAVEKEQMRTSFEKKLAEVKMNALTAQMNPHFIFNSLNSIDYFIIKNESVLASEYLNRFSRLIRLILNNSRSNYISLKDDLDALKLYIEIESLRFDNKFEYEVKASKNLDPELIQIPPMLFQPYVENAIWHGLMQKEGSGKIEVKVELDEKEELIIGTITDNGIGRKKAMELKSKGVNKKKNKSMGMQITHDKIEAINFLHDLNASVSIHDLVDDAGIAAGTQVVLEIPI